MTQVKIAAHLRNQTRAQLEYTSSYCDVADRLDRWEPFDPRPEHLFRRSGDGKRLFIFGSKFPTGRYDLLVYAFDAKYDFIEIAGRYNLLQPALAARKVIASLRRLKYGSELVERTLKCVREDDPNLHWDLTVSEAELLASWVIDDEPEEKAPPISNCQPGRRVPHLYLVR